MSVVSAYEAEIGPIEKGRFLVVAIRIVLDGLRGEESIAAPCRRRSFDDRSDSCLSRSDCFNKKDQSSFVCDNLDARNLVHFSFAEL
ncbi:hypothetical protein HNQ36_005264 [Afipia massiliensis]|uniref:Uncharacterized protein n=1 Tax=Afipia massiliensis TaxID=211460 RepID=A0A840N5B6_9BRAD|nr:hypothetical protein [Afipia massiliensis]MBB5055253.1 hypothetical protein [Afipia massiliensis]